MAENWFDNYLPDPLLICRYLDGEEDTDRCLPSMGKRGSISAGGEKPFSGLGLMQEWTLMRQCMYAVLLSVNDMYCLQLRVLTAGMCNWQGPLGEVEEQLIYQKSTAIKPQNPLVHSAHLHARIAFDKRTQNTRNQERN
ncbi:hypothetical protein TNCV_766301 [Trichonephila clavipes]|nr:hypothetical protein TNCV_766301 [Trichonephila clavipes]